jgi:hypothetical protein
MQRASVAGHDERIRMERISRTRTVTSHGLSIGAGVAVLAFFRLDAGAVWLAAVPELAAIVADLCKARMPRTVRARQDARKLPDWQNVTPMVHRRDVRRPR